MKHLNKKTMINLAAVVVGNFIYAFAVKLFLLNADLITGGAIGIALTMNHWFGLEVTDVVFVFNTAMLIWAWFTLGKGFVVTTIASSYLYPFFIDLLDWTLGNLVITTDPMLNALFCGIGIGISQGIVIRAGSSTGGVDVPCILMAKHLHMPVSIAVYILDMIILLMQLTFSDGERVLYGIVMAVVYTVTMDKMFMLGLSRTELKIISPKTEEITQAIFHSVDRGVTLLDAKGGYTGNEMSVVMTVVSNRELSRIQELVYEIDPTCFMVINRVSEVRGRGFTMGKDD